MNDEAEDELDVDGRDALMRVFEAARELGRARRREVLAETACAVQVTRARDLCVPEHLIEATLANGKMLG